MGLARFLGISQTAGRKTNRPRKLRRGEARMGVGEIGIKIDGLTEEFFGERIVVPTDFLEMPQPALVRGPGVEAFPRLAHRAVKFGVSDRRGDGDRHGLRNLVLHHENVGEVAVVALGPDVLAGRGLDQLCGDADSIAGLA
jgi:hypothetical protein